MHILILIAALTPADAQETNIERLQIIAKPGFTPEHYAIDDQKIDNTNAQHPAEQLSSLPSVWVSRGNNQESLISVRSPVLTGAGACGAFLVAEDGIPIRPAGFCNVNQLFETHIAQAERIELFSGPASQFYGTGALHGSLNLISRDPFTLPSRIRTQWGAYGYNSHDFSHQLYQSDQQAIGIQGRWNADDGYQQDAGFDQHKWQILHGFDGKQWRAKSVLSATHLAQNSAGYIVGEDSYKDDAARRENLNPDGFRHASSVKGYSRWQRQIDNGWQLSVTPFWRRSQMHFSQHYLPWQAFERNSQQSAGVNLLFSSDTLKAGFSSEWASVSLSEYQTAPFSPTIPEGEHYHFNVRQWQLAPWLSWQYDFSDRTRVNTTVRWDHISRDYRNHLTDGSVCAADVTNCRFYRAADEQDSDSHLSLHVQFEHQLNASQQVYATLSDGYRSAQITERYRLQGTQQQANLAPETMLAAELGWRMQHRLWQAQVNLYHMHKQDVIIQDSNRFVLNEGETRHLGIEGQLRWQPTAQWQLSHNLSYAKHSYENNPGGAQIDGNDIDTAPRWQASTQVVWQIDPQWQLDVDWQYLGKYFLDPQNLASYPGHQLINTRLHWQATEPLKITLAIHNLTNQDYAERADYGFGSYRYFVGMPARAYLQATYSF